MTDEVERLRGLLTDSENERMRIAREHCELQREIVRLRAQVEYAELRRSEVEVLHAEALRRLGVIR